MLNPEYGEVSPGFKGLWRKAYTSKRWRTPVSLMPWCRRLYGKTWREGEGVCWEGGGRKYDVEVTAREKAEGTCEGRGRS